MSAAMQGVTPAVAAAYVAKYHAKAAQAAPRQATKRPRCDKRGPVVVVSQWDHQHGPDVWFPAACGATPTERLSQALRSVAAVYVESDGRVPNVVPSRSVWVCERGQWRTA